jgi:CheY-like chemotaxis protein
MAMNELIVKHLQTTQRAPIMTDSSAEPQPYEHRALLLDDDDANRMLLSVAFDMVQLPFVEAQNGEQALRLYAENRFAFAFLDIDLPDISGIEVARRIRAQDQGIALIMCSANDDPLTLAEAVAVDCDLFFVKPFQLDTLLNTVKMLDRAALRANPRILIVDNTQRPRWENRLSSAPNA